MKKILGIELGSTRIKSVLIDESGAVIAQGSHDWENQLENGLWTYSLEAVWSGIQASYGAMCQSYGEPIAHLDAIGISAMMHGYLAFDKNDNLLVPFRTWRNTNTAKSASKTGIIVLAAAIAAARKRLGRFLSFFTSSCAATISFASFL